MKIFVPLILGLLALPAHAQVYKWTDANGTVHYSDHPQDGRPATELQAPRAATMPASANDDWRERERSSRESRLRQAEADRRPAAIAQAAAGKGQGQGPYNPSAHRTDKPMTDDEVCDRDRQQIEYAEKTRNLAIGHGSGAPQLLTEAQRQEVISERKANHALTCGDGRRR
jgi:hypothetical protein